MRLIADTHTVIWFVMGAPQLSIRANSLLTDVHNDILVSPASIWEVAIKVGLGKIQLNCTYRYFVDTCLIRYGFSLLPVNPDHTTYLASMTPSRTHKDPFDRLIIAQAIVEHLPIIGADLAFDGYPVQRLW